MERRKEGRKEGTKEGRKGGREERRVGVREGREGELENQGWTQVRVALKTSRVPAGQSLQSSVRTQHSGNLHLLEACGGAGTEGPLPSLLQPACIIGAATPACPQT